jgi:hypothetical protein
MKEKLPVLLFTSIYGRTGTINACFMLLPYVMNMTLSVAVTV